MAAKAAQPRPKTEANQARQDDKAVVEEQAALEAAGAIKGYRNLGANPPRQSPPPNILSLQASLGNQAVFNLLSRTKLPPRAASIQRQEEEEELQARPVQRQEEEEVQAQRIQRAGDGGFTAGTGIETRLASSKSGGSPLDVALRMEMEQRFGADFQSVKIHSGIQDAQLSRDLGAQAFTHGSDIYMGEGKYNPGSTTGMRLLAHELTHVIQQTGPGAAGSGPALRLPARLQRDKAFTTKTQPTYARDTKDVDKVKSGRLFGKASTGNKIPQLSLIDIASQPASNDPGYYKMNGPNFTGDFIEKPELVQTEAGVKVASASGSLVNGANKIAVRPGDILSVTGSVTGYYIAANLRDPSAEGAIEKSKLISPTPELSKSSGYNLVDAAVNRDNVSMLKPLDTDRAKSVGGQDLDKKFVSAGNVLKADFGAAGVSPDGKMNLVYVQDQATNHFGYIESSQLRDVTADKDRMETQYGGGSALEAVNKTVIVTSKTALRQIRKDAKGNVSMDSTHAVNPGVILRPTPASRFVVMDNRPWNTDLMYKGSILGSVDNDKSKRLEQDIVDSLKLSDDPASNLTRTRVKGNAHLRQITTPREHSIETGPKIGTTLKADTVLDVNLDIRGVDENFSFGWVYAKTSAGVEGYVREEKLSEGVAKDVKEKGALAKQKGKTLVGVAIPATTHYVAAENFQAGGEVKLGDLFTPEPDATATDKQYWELKNLRTSTVGKLPKDKLTLVSEPLEKAPQSPYQTALVTAKTGLHKPVHTDRNQNVGVSKEKLAQFQPGDRFEVDFTTGAISTGKDTNWHFASANGRAGYVRGGKIRESSAELLAKEEGTQAPPDLLVPVYVIRKTTLRDKRRNKKESLKAGEMIMVNYTKHPAKEIQPVAPPVQSQAGGSGTGSQVVQPPPAPVPTKYFKDHERWVLAHPKGSTEERYVHDYKITARSVALTKEPPGEESTTFKGIALEAANILFKGASDVLVEDMMPDEDPAERNAGDLPIAVGAEQYGIATTGILGGITGLIGAVAAIRSIVNDPKSFKTWFFSGLDLAGSLTGGVGYAGGGATAIYKLKGLGDSDAGKTADSVGSWASGIAYGIASVKDLFMSIYELFTSNKNKKDKVLNLAPKLLSSAYGGLKAAETITKIFNPAFSALSTAIPVVSIAMNMATAVLGFRKWVGGVSSMKSAIKAQKSDPGTEIGGSVSLGEQFTRVDWAGNKLVQSVISKVSGINTALPADFTNEPHVSEGDKSKKQLFWKEKRGVRSLSTVYRKKLFYRVNPKLLIALRNKDRLDKRLADGTLVKRSNDFLSADYYLQVDANGKAECVAVNFDNKWIKIDIDAEKAIDEYELASKVEEVSRKKATLGIEAIETSIVNIVGDALTLGGITATAGAITKGTMTAINAGFDFARFINKQIDSSQGKKYATTLKYKGEITGVDKSQIQKKREYYEHAFFIMEQIGSLAAPKEILAAAKDPRTLASYCNQYRRVQQYVDMTGVYADLFYRLNGNPKKQVDLLVESLSER